MSAQSTWFIIFTFDVFPQEIALNSQNAKRLFENEVGLLW
jgi:hypothetical protein